MMLLARIPLSAVTVNAITPVTMPTHHNQSLTMKSVRRNRIRRHRLLMSSLAAISTVFSMQTFTGEAFSTASLVTRTTSQAPTSLAYLQSTRTFSSTLDCEYELSTSSDASPIPPITPNTPTAPAIQSRTISTNYIINSSILLIAIITILYQVLSVDLGITRGWSPEEIAARIPLDNWRSYTNVLNMAPLQTKAVTSATVYTIGDIIAQNKEGRDMGELDRGRILRSLLAGLIGHGPMSHVWYHVSEDFFDGVLGGVHWWDFIPKVIVDQTVFGPIWNNSYIILLGIMQLQRPSQIWSDMKRTTIPLIVSGLKLWPFVHCITYGVIPLENRLLWVDAVEIVWVTILASQAAGEEKKSPQENMNGEMVPQEETIKR
ncbi:hypothetical protein HJC23_002619 [Cyclotella cryptica]|uniref:Uncharacterized protein n=1 Tax=Cyclotella cryptica TaxID=29204 RepID=A0ABD3PY84_9STRA